jgi:hypothetical protein
MMAAGSVFVKISKKIKTVSRYAFKEFSVAIVVLVDVLAEQV